MKKSKRRFKRNLHSEYKANMKWLHEFLHGKDPERTSSKVKRFTAEEIKEYEAKYLTK